MANSGRVFTLFLLFIFLVVVAFLYFGIRQTMDAHYISTQKENMIKTLYIVRHAKSDWSDASLPDFERPLNNRGDKDAPLMGDVLVEKGAHPDLFITSPALRAVTTAKIIASKLIYPENMIRLDTAVYHATAGDLIHLIEGLDDSFSSVMLVGHNPAITGLANYLTDTVFENIPTCGIVAVEFSCNSWIKIERNSGRILYFEYPKKKR